MNWISERPFRIVGFVCVAISLGCSRQDPPLPGKDVTEKRNSDSAKYPSTFAKPAQATSKADSPPKKIEDAPKEEPEVFLPPKRENPADKEDPAVAAYFKRNGWLLRWNRMADGKHIVSLLVTAEAPSGPISLDDYKMIARSKTVGWIDLLQVSASDDGLKILGEMQNLEDLVVSGDEVTDKGLRELARLPKLERLSLVACGKVTGSGFEAFAKSTTLKAILLNYMGNLTNAGARELGRIPNLEVLTIDLGPLREESPDGLTAEGVKAVFVNRVPAFVMDESLLDDELFLKLVPKGLLYGTKNAIATRYGQHSSSWPTSAERVREISLDRSAVTAKGLATLRDCRNVSYLSIRVGPAADEILKAVSGFKKLKYLHVRGNEKDASSSVTGAGTAALVDLPLEELSLVGCTISDDAVQALARSSTLHDLYLRSSKIKPEAFKHLAKLTTLTKLNLMYGDFDNTAAKSLSSHPTLQDLDVSSTNFYSEAGKFDHTGLQELLRLPKLKTLNLRGTGVGKGAVQQARRGYPGVKFDYEGQASLIQNK